MLHLYDSVTMAHALTLDLEPTIHSLLRTRIEALGPDLINHTEYVVIEPGDTEEDIIRRVGFSPLVEPIEGARFGQAGFHPYWDWMSESDGWFEIIITFGGAFAYVLLIPDADAVWPELLSLVRHYSPA